LAKDSRVTIKLYDKAGKIVCKLIQSEPRSAGTNEEEWDGRNYAGETLATGAYIVEIIANGDRRYTALAIVGK
jgi:flagellar hook assembly protein FlgD